MIEQSDRNALISYRMQQAFETFELAKFLVANDKLVVAVNRIYYGMYYALTALALQQEFETSKHRQLIGWFNKEFVFSGKPTQNLERSSGMLIKIVQKAIMTPSSNSPNLKSNG
jgi:uncharacterized protein (UPF0332 family)